MSDIKKDTSFQAPQDANPLGGEFKKRNGGYDTPEEIIEAILRDDRKVLEILHLLEPEELKEIAQMLNNDARFHLQKMMLSDKELQEKLGPLFKTSG